METGGSVAILDLVFQKDRCDINFQGRLVALMQKKLDHCFRHLKSISKHRIQFMALVPRAELDQKLDEDYAPAKNNNHLWSMNIQVFGFRCDADKVATELSKCRLFLQRPYPEMSTAVYDNPQSYIFSDLSFPNGHLLPPITVQSAKENLVVRDDCDLLDVLDELRNVMNHIPTHKYHNSMEVDNRILTPLLR